MIPGVQIVLLACALAAPEVPAYKPPSFEEMAKLEGKEFLEVALEASSAFSGNKFRFETRAHEFVSVRGDECPYTVDQLVAVADKCRAFVKPIGSLSPSESATEPLNPFRYYFAEACKKANDDQLNKLLDLYSRLDPDSHEKSRTLLVLAGRVLVRKLASIPPQHLELGDDGPALPPELQAAPEELKNAWKTFQRAKASFDNAFPKPAETIEVSDAEKPFYELIDDALKGAISLEDELRPYALEWPNCMGVKDGEDAYHIAMLLMLLREGRMNEAIGAALRVAGTQGSISSPEDLAEPIIDLLERCGLNWEEIFAGGQVENEARGWELEKQHPYLDALASHGSERAAPLVEGLAHFAKPEQRSKYLVALGAWVETVPNLPMCNGEEYSWWSSAQTKRVAKPMPPNVQEMALHLTEELAADDAFPWETDIAIDTLARTQSPSSIPVLQALTRHSSDSVAKGASRVLCAMGQENLPHID